jgi:type IV secretion system protein VirB4
MYLDALLGEEDLLGGIAPMLGNEHILWAGQLYNPCPFYPPESPALMVCTTEGSTPFRFNLHVGDLGHTLVFGPTGSGKSTLLALIAAQFMRYKNAQIFAFDKGLSLYPLCAASGGNHYHIGEDDFSFAPLTRIDESEKIMKY